MHLWLIFFCRQKSLFYRQIRVYKWVVWKLLQIHICFFLTIWKAFSKMFCHKSSLFSFWCNVFHGVCKFYLFLLEFEQKWAQGTKVGKFAINKIVDSVAGIHVTKHPPVPHATLSPSKFQKGRLSGRKRKFIFITTIVLISNHMKNILRRKIAMLRMTCVVYNCLGWNCSINFVRQT